MCSENNYPVLKARLQYKSDKCKALAKVQSPSSGFHWINTLVDSFSVSSLDVQLSSGLFLVCEKIQEFLLVIKIEMPNRVSCGTSKHWKPGPGK